MIGSDIPATADESPQPQQQNLQTLQVYRTLFALFDDTIDTELALGDFRKANLPAEEISAILREQVIDMARSISNQTILSRVVTTSALDTVSGWLRGLLTLVLSDRAAYVVAGPIGVLLASSHDESVQAIWDEWTNSANMPGIDMKTGQLARALARFGVDTDEASYVEQRVIAGSTLIAITSANVATLRIAHDIYSRRSAVHVGLARTDRSIMAAAADLLDKGPQAGNNSVVVVDAMSPLVLLSAQPIALLDRMHLIGKPFLSQHGEQIGEVTDALVEKKDDSASPASGDALVQRYLVVRHRSMMKLRQRVVAVPTMVVTPNAEGFVLNNDLTDLKHAPKFNPLNPLSRQQEVRIRQYFNVSNYWLESQKSAAETENT